MIKLDVNELRSSIKETWRLNIDEKYTFFYDESNNCRKFWIKGKMFNAPGEEDFVLAGVGYRGTLARADFNRLWDKLNFQKNVKEIKFINHFPKGNFIECMGAKRTCVILNWLMESDLFIHFSHVNNMFYAVTDIIDSIIDSEDIELLGFDGLNSLKNKLYLLLVNHRELFLSLMIQFNYPNIQEADIEGFCKGLLSLFDLNFNLTMEEKYIKNLVKRAAKRKEFIFLMNNEDRILQQDYVDFYLHPIYLFKNSKHIFDDETEISSKINQYELWDGKKILNNYKFINSINEPLVQVSDVISGILGKFFKFINSNNHFELLKVKDQITSVQKENISILIKLIMQSQLENKAFMHSVVSQHELSIINDFWGMFT